MTAQCLSIFGPCKEICDVCIKSHEDYLKSVTEKAIEKAKHVLQYHGYKVEKRKELAMTQQEIKRVWAVYTNTDLTEGRGHEYVKHFCGIQATAIRKAKGAGVQGSNALVREVELIKHFNSWYGPIEIEHPTEDDIVEQIKLSTKLDAIKKAKEVGLTDNEIAAIRLS